MLDLNTFERQLQSLLGKPSGLRPFVCDGSPLTCRAFIVGFNPATALTASFWQYWRQGCGFDKAAWFAEYQKERLSRPLKPGRKLRRPISNTRRVIEWILQAASPVKCLETNIYATPTEQAVDLACCQRVTEPFDFLLRTIRPRVIVVHGKDAAELIERWTGESEIIKVAHFSRGWSAANAKVIGERIRAACSSSGNSV